MKFRLEMEVDLTGLLPKDFNLLNEKHRVVALDLVKNSILTPARANAQIQKRRLMMVGDRKVEDGYVCLEPYESNIKIVDQALETLTLFPE